MSDRRTTNSSKGHLEGILASKFLSEALMSFKLFLVNSKLGLLFFFVKTG